MTIARIFSFDDVTASPSAIVATRGLPPILSNDGTPNYATTILATYRGDACSVMN